jgi:peptidoglycan/LPS O-acetylase OafA/YrhL
MIGPSMQERVRQAFSLRRNVELLLRAPGGHLAPLDGWRAIAILWTVGFHSLWYVGHGTDPRTYFRIVFSPFWLPLWRGHFGVDLFFVLSGFLIGGMLLDEHRATGRVRFGLFYVRRLMRLWPALVVGIAAYAIVERTHWPMLWTNLFYVSNFVPILLAAMPWTWSLAIEEHFYLVAPLVLDTIAGARLRTQLAAVAAITLALIALDAWVIVDGELHVFDTEIALNRPIEMWARGYDALYSKPWMRLGPMLAGVAGAMLHRAPEVRRWVDASAVRGTALLLGALALAVVSTHWPLFFAAPRWLEVTYMAAYRTTWGAGIACLMLFSLSAHRVGAGIGRALSARWLYPFSQLAYAAYLVNPLVSTFVGAHAAEAALRAGLSPMLGALPVDFVVTFAGATIVHLAIERPIMHLRPNASTPDTRVPATAPTARRIAGVLLAGVLIGVAVPWALVRALPPVAEALDDGSVGETPAGD